MNHLQWAPIYIILLSQVIFVFLLFLGMIMLMKLKQKKLPEIKN